MLVSQFYSENPAFQTAPAQLLPRLKNVSFLNCKTLLGAKNSVLLIRVEVAFDSQLTQGTPDF